MTHRRRIVLDINGERHELDVEDRTTLADALRDHAGLRGTRVGCEQGACGTCTVLVDGAAVRSCLLFAVQLDGGQVIETIEGLVASGRIDRLRAAFQANSAFQCGFCTSGFLVLAHAHLEEHEDTDRASIRHALSANLCRCTGYEGLVDAVAEAGRADAEPGAVTRS